MPGSESQITSLVQRFRTHLKAYKSKGTQEATIRQQFIDPFWEALGWDVRDTGGVGPSMAEVIIEKNIETAEVGGLRNRRPDYLFRLGGFPRFVVEAKKPVVDLDTDWDAIFQAKQYAWNATIPFAILTDFEQFRLYDTTLAPIFNSPGRGLIKEFSLDFEDYETQWDVLADTFGREAVADGSLERLLARVKKFRKGRRLRTVDRMLYDHKGIEPVDKAFLAYLDTHRRHFASVIYRDNRKAFPDADTLHGAARLTEAVQRIMDRLVFMRVIEDRDIAAYGTLRGVLDRVGDEGGEFYDALCDVFRAYDNKYNGYLYKGHFSETLRVDGAVLADFTRTLYPPDRPWDFAAIGDDILGIVYEKFLGNVVTVSKGRATIEEKPEVRHAGGVYYTPRFVVDSIIRRVVGPKLEGRAPAEVLDVKILDPACGSGSFLVAALQYLFDFCVDAVTRDPSLAKAHIAALDPPGKGKNRKKKAEIAFRDKEGAWHLAPDFRAALLTHCIHGVDIDQQAVEVTVMSLYLKMLESKLPENWATLWVERQLLPPLDNNIRCGNSLIDPAGYDNYLAFAKQGAMFEDDADTAFRINQFDWESRTHGFGRLLDKGAVKERGRAGFDCIIGNPPYIRVQELNKWAPEECGYYKWKYKSAAKGSYDIYVVFTEKALGLLAPDGLLGFIMPHKWWQAKYGEGLRKIIADGKHLKAVVDFGDQQVFVGATTYTAIHIMSGGETNGKIDYAKVEELEDGRVQCAGLDANKTTVGTKRFKARKPETSTQWVFTNAADAKWLMDVSADHATLGNITSKIAQGIVSGCDPVFYLEHHRGRYISKYTECTHQIEDELVHPLLKGSVHIRRWAMDETTLCVLFPYELRSGVWKLIEPKDLKRRYPLAASYFAKCRKKLIEREKKEKKDDKGKRMKGPDGVVLYDRPFDDKSFYRFSRPQNFEIMPTAKLLVPAMAERAEYAIDSSGKYYFVGSGGGGGGAYAIVPSIAIDLHYLCGLLNSTLLDAYLQRVTTPFHSGWFAYSKAYISQIPIKLPETAAEKKLAKRITSSVKTIMEAKTALQTTSLSDRERSSLETKIESHEKRIDTAVFALYGVDGLPGE